MAELGSKLAAANSANNNDDSDDDHPDFVGNETSDGYFVFSDGKAIADRINTTFGYDKPSDLNTYRLTRDDIPKLRQQAEEEGWHPNVGRWAVDAAMKSWLGTRQRELNEGFGVGLEKDDDNNIVGWQEGQYAYHFGDILPTVEHEELTDEEMATLEEHDVNTDHLGFRPDGNPVLPVLGGERAPVFVETFDELDAYIEQVAQFPDEPTLGNREESETTDESDDDTVVAAPGQLTVRELEAHLDETDYGADDLETMLANEANGKDRKTANAAIESTKDTLETDGGGLGAALSGSDDESEAADLTREEKIQAFNNLCESGVDTEEAAERVGL